MQGVAYGQAEQVGVEGGGLLDLRGGNHRVSEAKVADTAGDEAPDTDGRHKRAVIQLATPKQLHGIAGGIPQGGKCAYAAAVCLRLRPGAQFMARPGRQFVLRKEIYDRVQREFEKHGIQFARREVRVRIDGEADSLALAIRFLVLAHGRHLRFTCPRIL